MRGGRPKDTLATRTRHHGSYGSAPKPATPTRALHGLGSPPQSAPRPIPARQPPKEALHDRRYRRPRRFRQVHHRQGDVARQLGFNKLDTGAMYRAVTFAALDRGIDLDDEAAIRCPRRADRNPLYQRYRRGHAPDHRRADASAAIRTRRLTPTCQGLGLPGRARRHAHPSAPRRRGPRYRGRGSRHPAPSYSPTRRSRCS